MKKFQVIFADGGLLVTAEFLDVHHDIAIFYIGDAIVFACRNWVMVSDITGAEEKKLVPEVFYS